MPPGGEAVREKSAGRHDRPHSVLQILCTMRRGGHGGDMVGTRWVDIPLHLYRWMSTRRSRRSRGRAGWPPRPPMPMPTHGKRKIPAGGGEN